MTKLGNIKFNDYTSDDDINQNIYTSSSDNYKYKNVRKIDLDCKKKNCNKKYYNSDDYLERDIYTSPSIDSDCNKKKCNNYIGKDIKNDKFYKVNKCDLNDSDSISDSESSFNINNKHNISGCEIITYDNSKDCDNKTYKSRKHKKKVNNQIEKNDLSDSISSLFNKNFDLSGNNLCDSANCLDSSKNSNCIDFNNGYKIPECNTNICDNISKNNCEDVNFCNNKICNFDQLDIIAKKLNKIIESFRTISHLIQYYLRILEEVKIQVSQSDISHSVKSCIETSTSLFSYIKADIERNKTFVSENKYNSRNGYYLTNGITKIYYIEKIKLKLLNNGEIGFYIYDVNDVIKEYELGNNYIDVNFEGDLYNMIYTAKEKAIHFNKYIQGKHMKVTSIFNLHLIYLNKFK